MSRKTVSSVGEGMSIYINDDGVEKDAEGDGPIPPCELSYAGRLHLHPRFPSGDCVECHALCTEDCKHPLATSHAGRLGALVTENRRLREYNILLYQALNEVLTNGESDTPKVQATGFWVISEEVYETADEARQMGRWMEPNATDR